MLSEWCADLGRSDMGARIAWVSPDTADSDPARFWSYVIAALQAAQTDSTGRTVGETALAVLSSPRIAADGFARGALRAGTPPTETFLASLINDIAAGSTPALLVLYDLHWVSEPMVHSGITFLLDSLPPQMHLVLSSRSDPPWPFVRLRARGEMLELRLDDLRFTGQESASFLSHAMDLNLAPEDAAALGTRTEGLVAGLPVATVSSWTIWWKRCLTARRPSSTSLYSRPRSSIGCPSLCVMR